eukprot:sb/3466884/
MTDTLVASNNTTTPKKIISQFQIRPVEENDCCQADVPVKLAPPPVTIKRSKSLKQERSKFSRTTTVPNRDTLTLPRRAVIVTAKKSNVTTDKSSDHVNDNTTPSAPLTTQAEITSKSTAAEDVVDENQRMKGESGITHDRAVLPEPAGWQTVVNTHRRGSSMTFVSTDNWASFEAPKPPAPPFLWRITEEQWGQYEASFHGIQPLHGFISGKQARDFLSATGLPLDSLAQIWDLSDMDHDGSLSLAEFSIAMHCVAALEAGYPLPVVVPVDLKESLLHHVTRSTKNLTTSSTATAGYLFLQTEAGAEETAAAGVGFNL